jgi:hypothetical protein
VPQSNIPVLLNRPSWTASTAPSAIPSAVAGSPRRTAADSNQQVSSDVQQHQLVTGSSVRAPPALVGEGRIYGTGGSDRTAYRGPVPNYNPVNRNMYNLQTGRTSLMASPTRYVKIDRQTDRRTEGQKDRRTEGQTD